MSRLSNSWSMMKASARVLRMDPELMIFPILSGVAVILLASSFALPFLLAGEGLSVLENLEDVGYVGYVLAFFFYMVLYTLMFFFNTALVGAAMIRLEGGDPTVTDGLNIAFSKLGAILEYALIAATVGMILKALEERAGFIGRIVLGVLGLAWSLTTYLTVPVLVTRDVSAFDAIRESASIFKKTWGEQVVGNAGIGLATGVIFFVMALAMVPMIMVASSVSGALVTVVVISFVGGMLLLSVAGSALNGIYCTALYRFATTGDPGEHFDARMMESAFRPKTRRW